MVEHAQLVACDEIVADLRKQHSLQVTRYPAYGEGKRDAAADQGQKIVALLIENLVDDITHDPRAEAGGGGNGDQADDGHHIGSRVFATVLRQYAADDGDDLACGNRRTLLSFRSLGQVRFLPNSAAPGRRRQIKLLPRLAYDGVTISATRLVWISLRVNRISSAGRALKRRNVPACAHTPQDPRRRRAGW